MESLVQTKTRIGDPIDRDGFAILLGVFHPNQIHGTLAELETASEP